MYYRLAVPLLAAVLLAGCGGGAPAQSVPASAPTTSPAPTAAPAPTVAPAPTRAPAGLADLLKGPQPSYKAAYKMTMTAGGRP